MEMMELHEEGNVQEVEAELEKLFEEFAKTEDKKVFVRIKYLNRFLEENAITNS